MKDRTTGQAVGPGAWGASLCIALLCSVGCQGPGPQRMSEVYAHHNAGRYAEACDLASRIAASTSASAGDEAAYMAGVCCAKASKPAVAERHLLRATRSADRRLAGQAMAELGLLYLRKGENERAATMLESAADRLEGGDRANAFYYAAVAQQQLGQWDRARINLALARGGTSEATRMAEINERLTAGAFTIQIGAFRDDDNARNAGNAVAARAAALDLGAVQLVPSPGDGLTRVQVGRFTSLAEAESAKRRLGKPEAVIVPTAR